MSLNERRDMFAAAALQGLIAGMAPDERWQNDKLAQLAFVIADEMIKAGDPKPGSQVAS